MSSLVRQDFDRLTEKMQEVIDTSISLAGLTSQTYCDNIAIDFQGDCAQLFFLKRSDQTNSGIFEPTEPELVREKPMHRRLKNVIRDKFKDKKAYTRILKTEISKVDDLNGYGYGHDASYADNNKSFVFLIHDSSIPQLPDDFD